MRSIRPVIAGNGLAILLTVVFLLPTTAVVAFVATGPIDDFFANIGIWLHRTNEWSFSEFDTIERFSKIGFAIRAIFIAVGISFLNRSQIRRVPNLKVADPLSSELAVKKWSSFILFSE